MSRGVRREAATREAATSSGHRLRVLSPAPRDVWQDQYESDPDALVTQSPAWLESMCALGGWEDASRLYETSRGRLLVLPMARRLGLGSGPLALQSSYGEGWGMGGLLATGGVTREDVDAVAHDLIARAGIRTLIRPNPLLAGSGRPRKYPAPESLDDSHMSSTSKGVSTSSGTGASRAAPEGTSVRRKGQGS